MDGRELQSMSLKPVFARLPISILLLGFLSAQGSRRGLWGQSVVFVE